MHRRTLQEKLAEELPAGSIGFSSKISSIETVTTKDGSIIAVLHLQDGTIIKTWVFVSAVAARQNPCKINKFATQRSFKFVVFLPLH